METLLAVRKLLLRRTKAVHQFPGASRVTDPVGWLATMETRRLVACQACYVGVNTIPRIVFYRPFHSTPVFLPCSTEQCLIADLIRHMASLVLPHPLFYAIRGSCLGRPRHASRPCSLEMSRTRSFLLRYEEEFVRNVIWALLMKSLEA